MITNENPEKFVTESEYNKVVEEKRQLLKALDVQAKIYYDEKNRLESDNARLNKTIEKMKVYLLQTISILKQSYCSPKYLYYLVPGSKRKIKEDGQIKEDILIPKVDGTINYWADYKICILEMVFLVTLITLLLT